ncbi:hypothetical protein TIFTF001_042506 [Ficus carica]|uniref:Uncharacterized protein n=1 Tax=Ficus carica TaxID=3494 RepID=A0AA88D0K9_FICCA|nr:hypothetical protein TIFTF001_042506 [Ficus carica]
MAVRHVVLAERKLTTYIYAVGGSLQNWYQSGFPAFQFHNLPASATVIVPLVSQCLARDARLWWKTLGERAMQGDSWAEFRALIVARYGPLPNEDADLPYRDPEIYNDMYLGRYLAMLRIGVPIQTSPWGIIVGDSRMRSPMAGMTVEHMINDIMEAELIAHILQVDALVDDIIQVPVDDAGIPEPLFEGGPLMLEDPIPAVPLQEIPPQEEEIEDFEDDPEEIIFDNGDWDVDSDASSVVTIEQID